MTAVPSIVLWLVFTLLGLLHFYWLFGGEWGLRQVIPTKSGEESFRPPPRFATLLVALVFVLFGLIYLVKSGLTAIEFPDWVLSYGYWAIPVLFILRAIGEFKYVGFFKSIRGTEFARADSKWFSPFCLTIGVIGLAIQVINVL